MTIHELLREKESRMNAAGKSAGLFFAFSAKQFHENKTPKEESEKYVDIGFGGFIPKSKLKQWEQATDEVLKWFESQIQELGLRKAYIHYELANHEAWYTGEIEDTLSALGEGYTAAEVWAVYNENKEAAYEAMGW